MSRLDWAPLRQFPTPDFPIIAYGMAFWPYRRSRQLEWLGVKNLIDREAERIEYGSPHVFWLDAPLPAKWRPEMHEDGFHCLRFS